MPAFNITVLVLLAIVALVQVVGLVLCYKAIVRGDERAKTLQTTLDSLVQRVTAVDTAVTRHLLDANGLLKTLGQTCGDSLTELRAVVGRMTSSNEYGAALTAEARQLIPAMNLAVQHGARLLNEVEELGKRIAKIQTRLEQEAVTARLSELHQVISSVQSKMNEALVANGDWSHKTHTRLDSVAAEIQGVRADLSLATKF